jgi:hypothetical protein
MPDNVEEAGMRALFFACIGLMLSLPLFAETKISYMTGSVTVLHGGQWTPAKPHMTLAVSDRIKSATQSKAVLTVDDTTRVFVGQNAEMEVTAAGKESFFNLLAGKIKAKVKLLSGNKFKVQTPVCVASVRGTEFMLSAAGELAVLEGIVHFSDLQLSQQVEVGEGQAGMMGPAGQMAAPRDMTPEEKQQITAEWQNFDQPAGASGTGAAATDQQQAQSQESSNTEKKDALDFDALRQEMREVVYQVKADIETAREATDEIKESDLSAGRTLRDVHGNVVRVEQHLLRPDNQTLQLLNLTKRSEYNYSAHLPSGWRYLGPTGARLDVLDITMRMNMPLPEQITEWPGYISSRGDDLHPETVHVKITNQDDHMDFIGTWTPEGTTYFEGGETKVVEDDQLVFNSYINGWTVDKNYESTMDGLDGNGDSKNELWVWGVSPEMRLVKDGQEKFVRLYTEGYVINNDGHILQVRDFTSSSGNPFIMLKQVAGEQIIFCRELDGRSFFRRGNLDLVYTPDLMIAVAQKLATQVSELNKTSTNSNTGQ